MAKFQVVTSIHDGNGLVQFEVECESIVSDDDGTDFINGERGSENEESVAFVARHYLVYIRRVV